MKTPQRLFCCALAVMLSSTSWARIGETLEECVERYGDPIDKPTSHESVSGGVEVRFVNSGVYRCVTFLGGKAAEIMIFNVDESPITIVQSEKFLEENADSTGWRKAADNLDYRAWRSLSKEREAMTLKRRDAPSFTVSTREFADLRLGVNKRPTVRGNALREAFDAAEEASNEPKIRSTERYQMERTVAAAGLVGHPYDAKELTDSELRELHRKARPIVETQRLQSDNQRLQGQINQLRQQIQNSSQ
jgi:hypothetical protein